jgi:hypothetical protein
MPDFPEIDCFTLFYKCGFAATRNAVFALSPFWCSKFPVSSGIEN